MGNDCFPKIPKECRGFGEANFDKRLRIARSLIETLVAKVAPPMNVDDSDGAWTHSIRRRFFEICPEDCYPLPDAPWNARGEFLADITWTETDKEERTLMACEIEWGTSWHAKTNWSLVAEHFEKLLPVKAPFKVFIFSSDDPPEGAKVIAERDFSTEFAKEKLEASLKNYGHHLPGEVYIFIDFPRTHIPDSPGKFRSFIWIAEEYGKAKAVVIKEVKEDKLLRPTEFETQWS
ncbi:MAG: hypothetical protein ACLP7O_06540 [Terracidiphilus sp.]